MSMLKEETIHKVRDLKLSISDSPFFPENHVSWPLGYIVCKSAEVEGNGHEFAESWFTDESGNETKSISPSVTIWNQYEKTHIEVSEYAPGLGPTDFKESFDTEEEAVSRLKKYYFDCNDEKFRIWLETMEESARRFSV